MRFLYEIDREQPQDARCECACIGTLNTSPVQARTSYPHRLQVQISGGRVDDEDQTSAGSLSVTP